MFSSKEYLEKKTGAWGVGRFKYLQALVTEFQDTSKKENKLQVLANLANFAYDPINYEYFRQLNILDLFLGEKKSTVSLENISPQKSALIFFLGPGIQMC